MLETKRLLFKTNYVDLSKSRLSDSLNKFDLPRDAAFKVFPRRKVWMSGNSSDGPGFTGWMGGEYDLYETGRIIDTEAFVAQSFQKKHAIMFKEGLHISSNNDRNLKYVKRRLREIQEISNVRFNKLLKEAAYNLVAFHNCYILKIRKLNASSGLQRKWKGRGKKIDPVAGYFIIPSEAMEVKADEFGTIQLYRQNMKGYFIEFDPQDIIHITYNKRTGYTMGCPPLEAVKDDILALRKIEESVESLIYKILFPIIHVKVGTDLFPARTLPDGVSEVAVATDLLKQLDDSGGIATSERVEVDVIGAESQALRIESYLKYFKQRVYTGLGMSGLDFGDIDGGGATAGDFVKASLLGQIQAYQEEIEESISEEMFNELLLESGRYEHAFEIEEDDLVKLTFSEIDIDGQLQKENHTINKANSDLLTTDEARKELGKHPVKPEDEENLHAHKMEQKNMDKEHGRQKKLATHTASLVPPTETTSVTKKATNGSSTTTKVTKTGTSKGSQSKGSGAANHAKSKTKPKNQHTKDWLITRTCLAIKNENVEQLAKQFADYFMVNVSDGILDPDEDDSMEIVDFKDAAEELAASIVDNLIELNLQDFKDPMQLSKKRDILILQAIDNAEHYVNNMLNI